MTTTSPTATTAVYCTVLGVLIGITVSAVTVSAIGHVPLSTFTALHRFPSLLFSSNQYHSRHHDRKQRKNPNEERRKRTISSMLSASSWWSTFGRGSALQVTGSCSTDDVDNDNKQKRTRETLEDRMKQNNNTLSIEPVGVVHSIYKLCVGTPRQGLLAPHAKGTIELYSSVEGEAAIDGLLEYSHVWVVFIFHYNTVSNKKNGGVPAKISPPALGGNASKKKKVGVFSTRSPHRYNPIGMSLVKLDGIRHVRKQKHDDVVTNDDGMKKRRRPIKTTYLDISGLDLVDGTPVIDIKPYVGTYDAPLPTDANGDGVRYPSWVSDGLATQRPVLILPHAEDELRMIIASSKEKRALQFYDNYNDIVSCITEVLSMDVRSQYQTNKVRVGKSKAEDSKLLQNTTEIRKRSSDSDKFDYSHCCTQQIDNLMLYFTVEEVVAKNRVESVGSGAEDIVCVQSIQLL